MREARLIEIDPHYLDKILKRWQTLTPAGRLKAGYSEVGLRGQSGTLTQLSRPMLISAGESILG